MEDYFKSINCEFVQLDVFSYNDSAKKFYTKNNYEERMLTLFKKLDKKSEKNLITHKNLRNYNKSQPKKLKTALFQGLTVFAKVPTPNIEVADVCFTVARLRYALFHYKQNFLIFFCEKSQNSSF